MRRHYVYLDLGFYEDCNLKCEYCRNSLIINHSKTSLEHFKKEIITFKKHYISGVVKMSGYGEITLWPHFEEALDFLVGEFPSIQIITNGTFPKNIANILCRYNNVNINFTIDGNKPYMNSYRTGGNIQTHNLILNNLDFIASKGCSVEVNSVMHKRNANTYETFLDYLMQYKGNKKFMVFPFPVKVFERPTRTNEENMGNIISFAERIDNIWKEFYQILPSIEYGKDMKDHLYFGRTSQCYVSWLNLGSGGRDERLICPNYGESLSYGDFIESFKSKEKCEKIGNSFLSKTVGPECRGCFNHYHILNLYIVGRIDLQELQRVPSLSNPETLKIVQNVKKEFDYLHQTRK